MEHVKAHATYLLKTFYNPVCMRRNMEFSYLIESCKANVSGPSSIRLVSSSMKAICGTLRKSSKFKFGEFILLESEKEVIK
jgi:hypothetical protein